MRKNHTDSVLYHLAEYGGVTPQDALTKFGCQRLAARVHDLRNRGFYIETTSQVFPNGKETTRYVPGSTRERRIMRRMVGIEK